MLAQQPLRHHERDGGRIARAFHDAAIRVGAAMVLDLDLLSRRLPDPGDRAEVASLRETATVEIWAPRTALDDQEPHAGP